MAIVLTLSAALSGDASAAVVERAVLSAAREDVERALLDVRSWPVLFRDIERVDDVRFGDDGAVYARVTSQASGMRHDIEVRRSPGAIALRVDESLGYVLFQVVELAETAKTLLVVQARARVAWPVKILISDRDLYHKLRNVVRDDIADLVRRFGRGHDEEL